MSESAKPPGTLLAPDALNGVRIAISASESPDLGRLGLVETHFRLALGEIARSVLISGGKLCYGGHLEADGYTALLIQELHRYSRRDKPLQICLAWQEHRKLSRDEFTRQRDDLGLFGEIICLSPEGQPVSWDADRNNEPEPVTDTAVRQQSLTGLRRFIATQTNGRVLIGGKRAGFQGHASRCFGGSPYIHRGWPTTLFGGRIRPVLPLEIMKTLGTDDGAWLPTSTDAPVPDERLKLGLDQLTGLSQDKVLPSADQWAVRHGKAPTWLPHRPSEIAALAVSLGLGRRFATRGP